MIQVLGTILIYTMLAVLAVIVIIIAIATVRVAFGIDTMTKQRKARQTKGGSSDKATKIKENVTAVLHSKERERRIN